MKEWTPVRVKLFRSYPEGFPRFSTSHLSLYLFNFPCYSPTHKKLINNKKKSSPLPTIATRRKIDDDDDDDDVEEGFTWKSEML